MKRFWTISCALALATLVLMPICGCSSDSDDDGGATSGQALNVAGGWTLSAEGIFPMTLNLTHAGTVVGGTVTDAENYAVRITGSTASPAGTTDGSRAITLIVTYSDGQVVTFSGNVAGDNNTMNGSYASNWAGDGGVWNATR